MTRDEQVTALAWALPDVMSVETAAKVMGPGVDPLDCHEEWYDTPRAIAEQQLVALEAAGWTLAPTALDVERLARAMTRARSQMLEANRAWAEGHELPIEYRAEWGDGLAAATAREYAAESEPLAGTTGKSPE